MSYYNQGYGYQPAYAQAGYPYTGQALQGQEWVLLQIPGLIRPLYVHTPTWLVYEYPVASNIPLGLYSMTNGVLSLYSNRYMNSYGSGYQPISLESQAALGLRYPMAAGMDMAYSSPYYGSSGYSNPYAYRFGSYGGNLNGVYM